MIKTLIFALTACTTLSANQPSCHPHQDVKAYSMNGNSLRGLATKSMGAKEFEVWGSSIAVGSRTPRHVHASEEVFIILKGEILAVVGDQEILCKAPATLICPANIPHHLINVGTEPTDHFLIVGIDSEIADAEGKIMELPWRK